MFDGEAIGAQMVEIVRGYVAAELEPLRAELKAAKEENAGLAERLAAVEARKIPELPEFPEIPEIDMEAIARDIGEQVAAALADIPIPQDGKSVDMAEVKALIGEAVAALPAPEKGAPGEPGEKGEPGEVDMDAVKALIGDALAALPLPERGDPGERGEPGQDGLPGRDGIDGKDGVGLANALKADGCLTLVMTDGSTRDLGRIDGKDGETFDLDDFDIEPIDERSIKLKFTKGDVCHSFELEFPVPIYRGVFSENETYARGDMVTWAGSQWHCDEPKGLKPGESDSGWALAVKKGRDGKDASK